MCERPTKRVNISRISPANRPEAMARLKQYYPGAYAIATDPFTLQALEMFEGSELILDLPVQQIRPSVKSEEISKGEAG